MTIKKVLEHIIKNGCLFSFFAQSNRLSELVKLLDHENENVRLWVSTHLLTYDEKLAKDSLKKIADRKVGLASFSAEMTLQEWSKGKLTYLIE